MMANDLCLCCYCPCPLQELEEKTYAALGLNGLDGLNMHLRMPMCMWMCTGSADVPNAACSKPIAAKGAEGKSASGMNGASALVSDSNNCMARRCCSTTPRPRMHHWV